MLRIDDKETESIERSINKYIEFFCEANITLKKNKGGVDDLNKTHGQIIVKSY